MEKNYIVTKSNKLINANYNLSLQEQKIILTLASMVQPQDTEFKEYEFKIKDFIELLEIKDQSKYKEVPKITKELMKKVFEIKEGTDILQCAWLCSARYKTKKGIVTLKFAPDLKPYMLQLKELYTSYRLDNVLSLKSKYSIRLYEILKSNLYKKNIKIELIELKNIIAAKEKSYSIYNNFKNRILIRCQKELNNKTDISFKFEEIKTGRKVTSIKFIIEFNKKSKSLNETATGEATEETQQKHDLVKKVQAIFTKHNITEHEASCILKDSGGNIDLIKQCYTYLLDKDIKNIVGYMRKLVKGFNEPQENNKISTFNNFKQRNYDFKDLEMKLLGWK